MDVEQRARELLAAEIEKLIRKNEDTPRVRQCYEVAEQIRAGSQLGPVMAVYHAAIIAALTPPEGYVLVPVEPTEKMQRAGAGITCTNVDEAREIWHAMLAACPEAKP